LRGLAGNGVQRGQVATRVRSGPTQIDHLLAALLIEEIRKPLGARREPPFRLLLLVAARPTAVEKPPRPNTKSNRAKLARFPAIAVSRNDERQE